MNLLRLRLIRKFPTLILTALVLGASAPSASAVSVGDGFGISPFWKWRTIETEHFNLTFPKELEPQSQKVARFYEEAFTALTAELLWRPRNRINVLVIDNTDAANGLSSPVLRFGMLLYLTPPENYFSTSQYDDWLKLLVFHEFTHFVNMDTTHGVFNFFRFVLGDILLPNTLWPTWMLEGLAVYHETKYSEHGGRGRSPYYEMVLRTSVEKGKLGTDWMNLSRVNSPNPWYPSGETAYMFGYHLWNQVAKGDASAPGEISSRSGGRVPFFINGNTENVTGKDWYGHWDDFVARATAKANADLATIRRQPVTPFETLEDTHDETLGVTVSPNEAWLAYSYEDENRWQTLRLRDLKTGETRALEDKFFGVGMAFTPDSRQLIYSSLHRRANYYFLSDLKAYDLATKRSYWLTNRLRARDPDLSRDGNWLVYTQTAGTGVHLQLAKVLRDGDRLKLAEGKRIVTVSAMDRISNPRLSPDQKSIVFSLKKNGESGERLMRYIFSGGKLETLVADIHYNRFPAFDRAGTLHFISNRTGVDNLYRWNGTAAEQVTNLTSGMILPAFAADGLYASVFMERGWALGKFAKADLGGKFDTLTSTISAPEAPAYQPTSADTATYPVRDYSPWNSLLPRQWAPLALAREDGGYVGGQVSGYDHTLTHQYILGAAYDYGVHRFDHYLLYQNRQLGVNIDLYSSRFTSNVTASSVTAGRTTYSRDFSAGAALSFPFQFTTSVLEPTLGLSVERDSDYAEENGASRPIYRSRYVPVQDFTLTYSDTRSSRLAVAPERGRRILAGVRRYDDSELESYKLLAKHAEYFHLGRHFVLSPSIRGMKVSHENARYRDANAVLTGDHDQFYNLLPGDGYDELGIRGYSSLFGRGYVPAKEVYSAALDLRFPLAQIFRGWGTNPIGLNQVTLNVFGETSYVPALPSHLRQLPSVGAGLRFSSQWLNLIPLSLGLEYQRGLNERASGSDEVFLSLNVSALPFDF